MNPVRRILLIEDDPDQSSLYTDVLVARGYAVTLAPRGERAMACLRQEVFDLALVDWHLPGLPGDQVVARIKAQHPGVAVILFSNFPGVEEIAMACGADAGLVKGTDIQTLRATIADLLAARQG